MLLKLDSVSKVYQGDVPVTVFRDLDFELDSGEIAAILGPSGSGKSSLLNIVGALTPAYRGKVMFDDRDLASLDDKTLAFYRNQEVGFVFQQHLLLPQLTLIENVLLPTLAFYQEANMTELQARARQLLTRVGLADRFDHRPGQLSGGECQRAAVVRALINKPKLLLADEPTGSLDQNTADDLAHLLLQLNQEEEVALLVVTHSTALADKIPVQYTLANGELSRN